MTEAKVTFNFEGVDAWVPCTTEEKMKYICQRYGTKIKKNINSLLFLYGGNYLNFESNFEELANSLDKRNKEMKVLVYTKENDDFICPKCGEKINLKTEKLDELILSYKDIKDKIEGIIFNLDNIIKSCLKDEVNKQLKNINSLLNSINVDIKKNNEELINLLNIKDYNNKNIIRGCLDINLNDINNKIIFCKTNFNNNFDVYINKEKINLIKEDNYKWKYIFTKAGKI